MDWTTLRSVGTIGVETTPSQKSLQPATDFLYEVAQTFAQASANFFDEIQRMPFIYRERQVQAELLPAIHHVADVVFVEHPINRDHDGKLGGGRLDYVVRYQKKFVFFIELKFGWVAVNSDLLRKEVKDAWGEAHHQVEAISVSDLEDLREPLGASKRRSIKMKLLVAPCYQASKDALKLQPYDRTIVPKINQRFTVLDPKPNLNVVWALHERLQVCHEYDKDRKEIYPCVAFVAGTETL
ncbi:MAG: hypothetical protein H6632_22405 [Anaerolineales bacterium]|nr:hypothetical protein [Anaerolineales bacterium]